MNKIKTVICIVFVLSILPMNAKHVQPLFPCSPILDEPYGVCSHINRRETDYYVREADADLMKQCGAGYVRSGLEYSNFVPNKSGVLHPKYIDSMYITLRERHLNSLSLVCGSGRKRPLTDTAWYSNYFTYIVKRYTRQITYWEILNEVDMEKKVSDIPAKYAELLRISRDVTARIDTTDKIVFSGVCKIPEAFLREVAKYDVADCFDIMNFHSYASPENLPEQFSQLQQLMHEFGWNKPVWITECGMSTLKDKWHRPWWVHTEAEQAKRLPRIYLISMAYGIDKVFWYNSRAREANPYGNEEHFGLWHHDMSPKPAATAYATLTTMCPTGSTRPQLEIKNKAYMASWQRPDGSKVWAIWATKTKTVDCSIKGVPQVVNHLGQPVSVKSTTSLTIGPELMYITGAEMVELQ